MSDNAPVLTEERIREIMAEVISEQISTHQLVSTPALKNALTDYVSREELRDMFERNDREQRNYTDRIVEDLRQSSQRRENTLDQSLSRLNENIKSWHELLNATTETMKAMSQTARDANRLAQQNRDLLDDTIAHRLKPMTDELFGNANTGEKSLGQRMLEQSEAFQRNLETITGNFASQINYMTGRFDPVEADVNKIRDIYGKWNNRAEAVYSTVIRPTISIFSGKSGAGWGGLILGILTYLFAT